MTVATYREPHAAHIARAALEAEGIPAFVVHENLVGLDWMLSQALGGVKVQVAGERAERARAVLREDRSGDLEDVPEASLPLEAEDACPRCGSSAIQPAPEERRAKALSLLLNVPFTYHRHHWRCQACGADWRIRNSNASPLRVLGYFVAFVLYLLEALLNALLSLSGGRRSVALLPPLRLQCWSCAATFPRGDAQCPNCGIPLPPPAAYEDFVEVGAAYDAACPVCHLPYRRHDYHGGAEWRCSACRSPLPG